MNRNIGLITGVCALAMGICFTAHGQNLYSWNFTTGNWTTVVTNTPMTSNDIALLAGGIPVGGIVTNDSDVSLGGLWIGNRNANPRNVTVTPSGIYKITFTNLSGGVAFLNKTNNTSANATGTDIINTPIVLGSNLAVSNLSTYGKLTIAGSISESNAGRSLEIAGGSGVTLSGVNTFSGGVTLKTGTLFIHDDEALGSGTFTIQGGTAAVTTNRTLANNVNLAGGSTFSVASSQTLTLNGNLSGTGSLTKMDSGILALTGANTYSGGTIVNGGILAIASTAALPDWDTVYAYTITSGAGLSVGNGVSEAEVATILGTGNLQSGAAFGFDTTAGDRTYGNAFSGDIGLAKTGSNTLTLTAASTHSGGTFIAGGALKVDNAGALGSDNITFTGGTLQYTTNSAATDWASRVKNSTAAIALDTQDGDVALAGVIDSSNTGGLTKLGAGSLTLAGANGFSGTVSHETGTLNINHASALGATTVFNIGNGATFDNTSGAPVTLAGSINVTMISDDNGAATFGGSNDLNLGGGTFSLQNKLVKTLTLNGGSTLTVGTALSARNGSATLEVRQGTGSGSKLVLGGFKLNTSVGPTGVKTMTIDTDTEVEITGTVEDGNLLYSGNLTKIGAGTLTLSGVNTYTGITSINGGVLKMGVADAITSSSYVKVTSGTMDLNGFNQTIQAGIGDGKWLVLGAGAGESRIETGAATLTLTNASATLQIHYAGTDNPNSATISGNLKIANGTHFLMTANDSTATDEELIISANMTKDPVGGIVYRTGTSASGVIVLAGSNNFATSPFQVRGGDIVLANDNALTTSGAIWVGYDTNTDADAALLLKPGITLSKDFSIIAETETARNRTLGTRGTGGTGTFAGNITLNQNVNPNTLLTADAGGTAAFTGILSGGGGINKVGAGIVNLAGNNTYAGTTLVSGGTLLMNGDASAATGAVTVDAGATLGGGGVIGGATTISGTHTPGNSPGIQTFNSNLTYNAGALIVWELAANTAAQETPAVFDQIVVNGDLDFAGAVTNTLAFNVAGSTVDWNDAFWQGHQSWTLFDVAGTTANIGNLTLGTENWLDSNGAAFNTVLAGASFSLTQSGSDVMLNYTAIPEPAVISLMTLVGAGLVIRRRMKHRPA